MIGINRAPSMISRVRYSGWMNPLWIMKNRLLAASLFSAIAVAAPAQACKCAGADHYDLVFVGEALSVDRSEVNGTVDSFSTTTRFKMLEVLQGKFGGSSVLVYSPSPMLCGVIFEPGVKYVVYAVLDANQRLETKYCYGRTETPPAGPQSDN